MTTYLGSKTAAGEIRDVNDVNGYPVKLTGSSSTERTATIASGTSLSDAVAISGESVVGFNMPAAWTAANLTFQVSTDGGVVFNNFYDGYGTEIIITASNDRYVRLLPSEWVGFTHIKLRSGASGAPVNQADQRVIKVVTRAV